MKVSALILPLLAVVVRGDNNSLRNTPEGPHGPDGPAADAAEEGRKLWGDWSKKKPSCVWSHATPCPHGGKGHCDRDKWLCESSECRGRWYPNGCGKHNKHSYGDWSQGGWTHPPQHGGDWYTGDWSHGGWSKDDWSKPETCDEPKFSARKERTECCPCCNEETCEILNAPIILRDLSFAPGENPPMLPEDDIRELSQSVYKFTEYALNQIDQCGTSYASYLLEARLDFFSAGGMPMMPDPTPFPVLIVDFIKIYSGFVADFLGQDTVDILTSFFQALFNADACPYDEDGTLLDRPTFGGNNPVENENDSLFDCCAQFLPDGSRRKLAEHLKKPSPATSLKDAFSSSTLTTVSAGLNKN